MQRISWNSLSILVIVLCHLTYAAPNLRIKRDDADLSDVSSDLNPIASEVSDLFGFCFKYPHYIVKNCINRV